MWPTNSPHPRLAACRNAVPSANLGSWKALQNEGEIPEGRMEDKRRWALRMGLTGSDAIADKPIPTFARGELPHLKGITLSLMHPMPRTFSGRQL